MKSKIKLEHGGEILNNNNKEADEKCAPSKKYTDGSCFTLDSLKKIASSYNKRHNEKIDINLSKEKLVEQLENKLSNKCSEQTCWLRLDFVKELENEEIENYTFRPKGPTKKYEWLSTTHIDEIVDQYQQLDKHFLFLGAVPYDFDDLPIFGINNIDFGDLEKQGKHKIGMVINLDEHYKSGSHWVALYTDLVKNQIYFFDSLGRKPMKRIRKFINRITKYLYNKKYNDVLKLNDVIEDIRKLEKNDKNKINELLNKNKYLKNLMNGNFDIRFNHIQHQFENSECGVYSVNFIIRLVHGESFESIINDIKKDDAMNECRKEYFRNVN